MPIISILQSTLPSWLFGHTAFPVFAFIFGFTDAVRTLLPTFDSVADYPFVPAMAQSTNPEILPYRRCRYLV